LQFAEKRILCFPDPITRKELTFSLLNILLLFFQNDSSSLLTFFQSFLQRTKYQIWTNCWKERKEKKFLKLWQQEVSLPSRSPSDEKGKSLGKLNLFQNLEKETSEAILSFLNQSECPAPTNIPSLLCFFFPMEEMEMESIIRLLESEFTPIDCCDGQQQIFLCKSFPWSLSTVSFLFSSLILDYYSQSSHSSSVSSMNTNLIPYSIEFVSALLEDCYSYLFSIPAIQSWEALEVIICYCKKETDLILFVHLTFCFHR
jgi:hypothetical protein